jgi:hypothetical protein
MPNSGFDIQFYAPRNGAPKPHFDKFEDGVEKAYGYLKDPSHSDFALAVGPSQRDAPVPTLMLERMPEAGVLAQLYVPEDLSPVGEDGWYNLVERANFEHVSIKDVSTVYQEPDRKDMVRTRLSEGVLFSPRMYVTPDLALAALRSYLETRDLRETLEQKPWKFVGLI